MPEASIHELISDEERLNAQRVAEDESILADLKQHAD